MIKVCLWKNKHLICEINLERGLENLWQIEQQQSLYIKLTRISHNGKIQVNHYDAEGLRHEIEESKRLVSFIFSDREVVAETEKESTIRYIRGYDILCSDSECARTYYHYVCDEGGSTSHILDETGKVLNQYEYDAFGNLIKAQEEVNNRFLYVGQQYDGVTMQYYLRARYYNPVVARFTQEDTYRGDGPNLYAYCQNNPVGYYDPSGHSTDGCGIGKNGNSKSNSETYTAPEGGGGKTATINVKGKTISFGHGGRHLDGTGLNMNKVNQALADTVSQLQLKKGQFYKGQIVVDGITIEFTSYGLSDNAINVGTYYPVNN